MAQEGGREPVRSTGRVSVGNPRERSTLRASVVSGPDGQPRYLVAHVVDVSELQEANSRLQDLVASQTNLIASVSHELRTPLTSLIGFAEVLSDASHDLTPDERTEVLRVISDQGADLSDLIGDLLVAARIEIGELTVKSVSVDLRAQVAQVIESMSRTAPKPIKINGGARAMGDPQRVRQILRNLVSNSIEYGGSEITIRAEKTANHATVSVADNGAPIPAELTERIFEPYVRAQHREGLTQSVGLGLSISRQLAELMNGRLSYQRNKGSNVFELQLPPAPEPKPSA